MSQSTLEVQASSPRRATPGFFPDNNLDVNGVEAADQTFPQKVVSLKQSSIVFLNVCVLGFAGIFSILFFFHYCFVFVLFCFIFSFLSQRDNHARRKVWHALFPPLVLQTLSPSTPLSTFLFDIEAFDQFWEAAESPEATGRSEFP